jgi:hypothetical protein
VGTAKAITNDPVAAVTADVFERGSGVPAALQRLGARVTVEPLAAGDYRLGGCVLIERKTVADLHGGVRSSRLSALDSPARDPARAKGERSHTSATDIRAPRARPRRLGFQAAHRGVRRASG